VAAPAAVGCGRVIDVALTPRELEATRTAVVIDALRATSTIAQALAGGYRRVLCCTDRERAAGLRGSGRVLAGEVACLRPAGFDLGNSPCEMGSPRGDELVLVTTNGTRAIVAAAAVAEEVVLAALVNLDAVLAVLPPDPLIVCAGTEGRPSVEDTFVAGSIARRLSGRRSDAALLAEAMVEASPSALHAFGAGVAARRLERAGLEADVAWCARSSVLEVVGHVVAIEDGVAIVEAAPLTGAAAVRGRVAAGTPSLDPA
jgi:2-phosphosulfolactate phosphatase